MSKTPLHIEQIKGEDLLNDLLEFHANLIQIQQFSYEYRKKYAGVTESKQKALDRNKEELLKRLSKTDPPL